MNNPINVEQLKEFDNHKLVAFLFNSVGNLRGYVAIHRGGINFPSFGATRVWKYASDVDALKDALRLSRLMSYKSAMAGLKYGGAKAVICDPCVSIKNRDLMIKTYAQQVNFLDGHFITGADVGISERDLKVMIRESQYMVGGKSDPVKFTALGVLYTIEVCLGEVCGNSSILGKTFAIQGVGKVGSNLLELIYKEAGKVYVADVNEEALRRAKKRFPKIEIISPSEIYKQKVDILSPCALSHIANTKNVQSFNCKILAGSANNQLENNQVGELLSKSGILYAPDYVANAGGLIAVADEYENGSSDEIRVSKRVRKIMTTIKKIIEGSKRLNKATNIVADEMAESIFEKLV